MQEVFEKIIKKLNDELECYNMRTKTLFDTGEFKTADRIADKMMGVIFSRDVVKQAAAEYNNGWIPCSKWLPEDGQEVLATDGEHVYLVEYDGDLDAPFGDLDKIIAWQPLPPLPELYKLKGD